MRTIKTAIIVDMMGSGFGSITPEMEVAKHKEHYQSLLKPHKLKCTQEYSTPPSEGTELLVYDFGGMLPGCSDLLESNARQLIKWAVDNPSCLAIVASRMTWDGQIQYELKDNGLDLPNVIYDSQYDDDTDEFIRDWFGLSKVEEEPKVAHKLIPKSILTESSIIKSIKLPECKFFEPNDRFFDWIHSYLDKEIPIFDVGSGLGHVAKALKEQGYNAFAIDLLDRDGQWERTYHGDGTTFPYVKNSIVMLCRPCHGGFPREVIEQALSRQVHEVIYISKPNNADMDLDIYRKKFRRNKTNVGKDKESLYSWFIQPKGKKNGSSKTK